MPRRGIYLITMVLAFISTISAQVEVSGLADVVFKNAKESDLTNQTFRGHSNFHTSRVRLFFDAAVNDKTYAFAQILMDNSDFQLYAAYVRFTEIAGPYLNAQVGLIPATVGTWGPRTYSNRNPLIGVPLLYNYHTAFNPGSNGQVRTTEDMLARRDQRDNHGLPIIYDACWNSGAEIYGSTGNLAYSLGLLAGSISKPLMQQEKNVPQVTTHLTYYASPSLDFGLSAYLGPYLFENWYSDDLPAEKNEVDYLSGGVGYDLHFARGHLEIFSELVYNVWQHPYLENLTALCGYVEAKYAFDVQWWLAGRVGLFEPGKLQKASGEKVHWDYPVKRYEFGIGYKPARKVQLKLVTQINQFDFTDQFDTEHFAFQASISF